MLSAQEVASHKNPVLQLVGAVVGMKQRKGESVMKSVYKIMNTGCTSSEEVIRVLNERGLSPKDITRALGFYESGEEFYKELEHVEWVIAHPRNMFEDFNSSRYMRRESVEEIVEELEDDDLVELVQIGDEIFFVEDLVEKALEIMGF